MLDALAVPLLQRAHVDLIALESGDAQQANDYGRMWISSAIVCALAGLNRPAEAAPRIERMRAQSEVNPAALTRAYLCVAGGIDVPVVPGIIPVHNFTQVSRFAAQCGAAIPSRMADRFAGLDDDPETTHLMAATVAAEQVLGLADQGVREFHFYTLNRAKLVYAICHLLGIRPDEGSRAAAPAGISPAIASAAR